MENESSEQLTARLEELANSPWLSCAEIAEFHLTINALSVRGHRVDLRTDPITSETIVSVSKIDIPY